jgi:hypothetical protein
MKSTSENKRTIAVLYIANYVALIIFVILFCLPVIYMLSPVFLLFLFASLVLFAIDTRMIKEKWYHFLGCTLPCAIVTITMTAIVYFAYNSGNKSALGITSIEALINFMIFHFYVSSALLWSSASTMFKYKKYVKNKTKKRFVAYSLIIAGLVIIAVGSLILYKADFMFKQTLLSILPLWLGVIINIIAVIQPDY